MLLALDIGNSNMVLGVYRGGRLVHTVRLPTVRSASALDLGGRLLYAMLDAGISGTKLEAIAVVNAVPSLAPALRDCGRRCLPLEPLFAGENLPIDLPVRYDPPSAVGADRLVNAAMARRRYGTPVIVLDMGTATTLDVVNAAGEFVGGAIAPGAAISLDALFQAAPHLPRTEIARPARAIGGSTVECLRSGAYYGFRGMIEGLIARTREELGAPAPVVATGGLAPLFADDVAAIDHHDPHLTLDGLHLLWSQSRTHLNAQCAVH